MDVFEVRKKPQQQHRQLVVRVADAEHVLVRKRAAELDMNISEYIRYAIALELGLISGD